MLVCPHCKEVLIKEDHSYVCTNGHRFDIAKQGYVNLSLKQKKNIGDNTMMVKARTQFLEQDHYLFMKESVIDLLKEYDISSLVDAGCGQGYYTKDFSQVVDTCFGFDLSKEAVAHASKIDKKTTYFVGNLFAIALESESMDCMTSIFVPESREEAYRVLKKNGIWIIVGPGPKHCWNLKSSIYETPYENRLPKEELDGFVLEKRILVKRDCIVNDAYSLFEMTPYVYTSSKTANEKVKAMDKINEHFEFYISVWRKAV